MLHARTTITSETRSGKSHVRGWNVVEHRYARKHYLFVNDGMVGYNPSLQGKGPGRCPENAPDQVWTHAESPQDDLPLADNTIQELCESTTVIAHPPGTTGSRGSYPVCD